MRDELIAKRVGWTFHSLVKDSGSVPRFVKLVATSMQTNVNITIHPLISFVQMVISSRIFNGVWTITSLRYMMDYGQDLGTMIITQMKGQCIEVVFKAQ